jgi:hypothetical protein
MESTQTNPQSHPQSTANAPEEAEEKVVLLPEDVPGAPSPEQIREEATSDIDLPAVLFYGALTVMLVIIAIVGMQAVYHTLHQAELERKIGRYQEAEQVYLEQERKLVQPEWVNQKEGVATIPLEQAVKLYVERQTASDSTPEDAPSVAEHSTDAQANPGEANAD